MSKKSGARSTNLHKAIVISIYEYLNIVSKRQGFIGTNRGSLDKDDIWLCAQKPFGNTGIYADITLYLRPTDDGQRWLVMRFDVNIAGFGDGPEKIDYLGVASGYNALVFHGKLPADIDQCKKPDDSSWIIRNAAQLKALFEAYDNYAIENDCAPVFTR